MNERTLEDSEYNGFQKRLRNQQFALDGARRDIVKAEQRARYWLDEINITKRKMRKYEENI